jgi:hypothetical protein
LVADVHFGVVKDVVREAEKIIRGLKGWVYVGFNKFLG